MLVSGAPALGANSDHRQQFTEGPLTTPVYGETPHPDRDAVDPVADNDNDNDEAVSIEDGGDEFAGDVDDVNEFAGNGDHEFPDNDNDRHDEEEGAWKDKRNEEAHLYSKHYH